MEHLFTDPQVIHRDMIAEVPHPTIGTLRLGGIPIRYSETPGSVRMHPPLLGEHTDAVLAEVLGYPVAKIAELKQQGAIA
jgi:crotonobetainyl-CoA:carnitine CoA-transferase CaiB-like acyl-CoA transferase